MRSPQKVFEKLHGFFGEQGWWPVAERTQGVATYKHRARLSDIQKLEVCAGAILVQNTAWTNAARALQNLKKQNFLSLETLARMPLPKLVRLIRSAGFFNQKAYRLQLFCRHVQKNHGKISKFLNQSSAKLRVELLELHGIGFETADSIILYAAQKPVFVVDAYTRRFVARFYGHDLGYVKCQQFFESRLPRDAVLFNEFHALLVAHAKRFCKAKPDCTGCVLKQNCLLEKNKTQK